MALGPETMGPGRGQVLCPGQEKDDLKINTAPPVDLNSGLQRGGLDGPSPGGPWSLGGEGEKLALTQLWAVGWGGPEGGCPEHSGAFPPVFAVYNQRPSPELLSPPPRDNEVLLRISFTKHFADDIC